jgi:two-component system, chemotaxis family, chemotaxis protein CheY
MTESSRPQTVLIADDALFMRLVIKEILMKHGYELAGEALTGKEAVSKYQELKPDYVIMDIRMPEINGMDALREIIELDSNAKVIMCSGMEEKEVIKEAMSIGACGFLIKPFQPNRLISALKGV